MEKAENGSLLPTHLAEKKMVIMALRLLAVYEQVNQNQPIDRIITELMQKSEEVHSRVKAILNRETE